jgi:hypothetical protein
MSVFFTKRGAAPSLPDENTILLLHGEELIDSSMYGREITDNGVTVSEEQSKFGGKSLFFDSGVTLTVDVPVEGDMTVDFWMYQTNRNHEWNTPFNWMDNGARGVYVHPHYANFYFISNYGYNEGILTLPPINLNEWAHIALVRQGTTGYGFINGVLQGTMPVRTANDMFVLGRLWTEYGYTDYNGFIDEVRVSDVARWIGDFTPPVEAYKG